MGFLEVNRRFLEHFWRNSGKTLRQFFGIFVARPKKKSVELHNHFLLLSMFFR